MQVGLVEACVNVVWTSPQAGEIRQRAEEIETDGDHQYDERARPRAGRWSTRPGLEKSAPPLRNMPSTPIFTSQVKKARARGIKLNPVSAGQSVPTQELISASNGSPARRRSETQLQWSSFGEWVNCRAKRSTKARIAVVRIISANHWKIRKVREISPQRMVSTEVVFPIHSPPKRSLRWGSAKQTERLSIAIRSSIAPRCRARGPKPLRCCNGYTQGQAASAC
jgi:hypothetical protein